MTQKLLVLELWGLGDLALASGFLRAACEKYSVTLLAKPHAEELRETFWPDVTVVPFVAPWTAFRGKYRWWRWPWAEMRDLRRRLRREQFDVAVSARPDPRDHWAMWRAAARRRVGYARAGGGLFLSHSLKPLPPLTHRYERWRDAAAALDLDMPPREKINPPPAPAPGGRVIIHTGAGQAARIWPLDRFAEILKRVRALGLEVDVLCDDDQRAEWERQGETAEAPRSIAELLRRLKAASAFVGNDSGPGHLAAVLGLPTFTVFGPSQHEVYSPASPRARLIEGGDCPHKPCFDTCRFAENHCLLGVDVDRVWKGLESFFDELRASD